MNTLRMYAKRLLSDPFPILLLLIIALAAWLRIDGLMWSLPHSPSPDESRIVDHVIVSPPGVPRLLFSDYGTVPFYILHAAGWLADQAIPGYSLHDTDDAVRTYGLARLIAAAFGVATVALVYMAASWAYDRKTALLASAFVSAAVVAIQLSHTYTVDVFPVFWSCLFLVIGIRLIHRYSDRLHISFAVVVGIALATKFVALFLLLPLAVALYLGLSHSQGSRPPGPKIVLSRLGASVIASFFIALLTFLALTPVAILRPLDYWWLDFNDPDWWQISNTPHLMWNLLMTQGVVRPLWVLDSMPSLPALLVMSAIGVGVALWQRRKYDWFLLSFLLASYAAVATAEVQFIRYVYPMVPVIAIMAVYIALALTLVITVLYAFAFTSVYRSEDTRLQAQRWIRKNVPAGAMVGIDGRARYSYPYLDPTVYKLHILPVFQIYREGTTHPYGSGLLRRLISTSLPQERQERRIHSDDQVDAPVDIHLRSDYLVVSNRITDQLGAVGKAIDEGSDAGFHRILRYYDALYAGRSPYSVAATFESRPRLWGFTIDDGPAEYSFKIVDHPTIVIYRGTDEED